VSLADRVDALAIRLPEGDPRKADFRRLIAALADECGCTMGGIFLVAATILAIAYFIIAGGLTIGSALLAIAVVFVASLVGKAIGLGLARIRLLRLRRVLSARLVSVRAEG
jgi:hypothetical protein